MQSNTRQFPDISFVDTDTEALVNDLITSYELFTGRTLYPADPARLFILWIADIIMQERVIIDASAKQNVPRFAEGDFLDSLAEIFRDTERLRAQPARVTFRFHISAPQMSVQIVPSGTRVTVDGTIIFETTEAAHIMPGHLHAEAPAICQTAGAIGNGFVPGQITQLVDLFSFFERVENITTSGGGADMETDTAFYERLRDSMEAFSTAGPLGAYVYWVKTASARIIDVKPTSPEPGIVDIRILLENGEMPDEEIIKLVLQTANDERTRPLTDFVKVSAPDPKPYDIDLTYFISRPSENSVNMIRAEVERAIERYKAWQSGGMGRDINPDVIIQLIRKAGAKRAEIRSPAFTVVENNSVAVLGSVSVHFGGVEDE